MVAAVKITRTDHTAVEFRGLAAKSNATQLILEGQTRHTAATQSRMDRQTLRHWVHRYNTEGVSGLLSIRSGKHPASLTVAQMAELKELTIKKAPIPRPTTSSVGAVLICAKRWSGGSLLRSENEQSADGCAGSN
jgi:transposase